MKNASIYIAFLTLTMSINAQIRITETGVNQLIGTSAMVDLSSNDVANSSSNIGKGIVYPEVNLTTLNSINSAGLPTGGSISFPSNFDGMMVFNTGEGNAAIGDDGAGSALAVSPGFYFYRNENRGLNGANTGRWVRLLTGADIPAATTDTTVYSTDGTLDANRTVTMDNNSINFAGGNVGIGAANPSNALVVDGAAVNKESIISTTATIDFSQSNLARTSASNASNFVFNGIVDGGTYSLVVTGAAGMPNSFTVNGFDVFSPSIETSRGLRTIYTIVAIGTEVYIYQTTGLIQL